MKELLIAIFNAISKIFSKPVPIIEEIKEEPMTDIKLYYPLAKQNAKIMTTKGDYEKGYPIGAVIHFTAGRSLKGIDNAINTVNTGADQGYCYFCMANDGTVIQTFPLNRWGYHAGESTWPELGTGLSNKLVGIEVCCAGKLIKIDDNTYQSWFGENYKASQVRYVPKNDDYNEEGFYHKYTDEQEQSLITLLVWLKKNNPDVFNTNYILGHHEIAPNRKNDPSGSLSMSMSKFRELIRIRSVVPHY